MSTEEVLNRSLSRGLKILQVINRHHSPSLATISREAEIPYPTARRIVRTLVEEGMIEREPDRKRYRPTALVSSLSVGYQLEDILAAIAWPILAETTTRIKWPLYISTRVGAHMMVKLSTDALTTLTFTRNYPGYTTPLLAAASGRAYLAFSNEGHSDAILGTLFPDTPRGHADRVAVEAELKLTRERGYAVAKHLTYTEEPGRTSGISVPITLPGENIVLATLSLIFFSTSMSVEAAAAEYLPDLNQAVARILAEL